MLSNIQGNNGYVRNIAGGYQTYSFPNAEITFLDNHIIAENIRVLEKENKPLTFDPGFGQDVHVDDERFNAGD